jgi:hypothetical protein
VCLCSLAQGYYGDACEKCVAGFVPGDDTGECVVLEVTAAMLAGTPKGSPVRGGSTAVGQHGGAGLPCGVVNCWRREGASGEPGFRFSFFWGRGLLGSAHKGVRRASGGPTNPKSCLAALVLCLHVPRNPHPCPAIPLCVALGRQGSDNSAGGGGGSKAGLIGGVVGGVLGGGVLIAAVVFVVVKFHRQKRASIPVPVPKANPNVWETLGGTGKKVTGSKGSKARKASASRASTYT